MTSSAVVGTPSMNLSAKLGGVTFIDSDDPNQDATVANSSKLQPESEVVRVPGTVEY